MDPAIGFPLAVPQGGAGMLLRSLHAQLRGHIVAGRLRPGVPLPSSRALAGALGVSRNTAVALYELLASEGYVSTRPGGGTFVAEAVASAARRTRGTQAAPDPRLAPAWREARPADAGVRRERAACDFALGVPDPGLFPFDLWRRLSARALRRLAREPAGYADPQGRLALRQAICGHVSHARAVPAAADDVLVCNGAQQAFDLIARILVTPGRTVVAVEEPGYAPLRRAFEAAGATLAPVPVDAQGLVVERLPAAARIVCVTPSHQFPLGMAMSPARRRALLRWAQAHGAAVVEDDYDGEFRYGARPLDALRTLDTAEAVFYVGSFSKTLFPGLRLGFVVAPAWARAALAAARQRADWHGGLLPQDTLAAFIAEGHLARHLRKARKAYAARREALLEGIHTHLRGVAHALPSEAGLHLACVLDNPRADAQAAVLRARAEGVYAASIAGVSGAAGPQGIVLGFGSVDPARIDGGLRTLARALAAR